MTEPNRNENENQNQAEETAAATDKKELTEKQKETRRRHALTCLNTHKTLEDQNFWRDHVDTDTFYRIHAVMTEVAPRLKVMIAEKKIDELRAMGVRLPKTMKIEFED